MTYRQPLACAVTPSERPLTREHETGADVQAWHRVDVRCWPALARTRITVIGVLASEAVEAIDGAIDSAEASAHSLTLDLTHIGSITAHALSELASRGDRPRDAPPPGKTTPPPDSPSSRTNAPAQPIAVPA